MEGRNYITETDYKSALDSLAKNAKRSNKEHKKQVRRLSSDLPPIKLPDRLAPPTKLLWDNVALQIIVECGFQMHGLIPVQITHGINALYNAVSLAIFGTEDRGIELRLRTLIEIVQNTKHYRKNYKCLLRLFGVNSFSSLPRDCIQSPHFSGFHLAALSTVVEAKIVSHYPPVSDPTDDAVDVLNRDFLPRAGVAKYTVELMWSGTTFPEEGTWKPNHFVPLLEASQHQEDVSDTGNVFHRESRNNIRRERAIRIWKAFVACLCVDVQNPTADVHNRRLRQWQLFLGPLYANDKCPLPKETEVGIFQPLSHIPLYYFCKYLDLDRDILDLKLDSCLGKAETFLEKIDIPALLKMYLEPIQAFNYGSDKDPLVALQLFREREVQTILDTLIKQLQKIFPQVSMGLEKVVTVGEMIIRLDYVFFLKDTDIPLFIIEVKSHAELKKEAISQAITQLFIVQKNRAQTGVDTNMVPLFNILTDGQRFIFMQILKKKIYLEKKTDDTNRTFLDVHSLTDRSFELIIRRFCQVMCTTLDKLNILNQSSCTVDSDDFDI